MTEDELVFSLGDLRAMPIFFQRVELFPLVQLFALQRWSPRHLSPTQQRVAVLNCGVEMVALVG